MYKGEKYARICTYTNQPMNEGFYIFGDYLIDTDEAKKIFLEKEKIECTFEQYMEENYSDDCYYTEWNEDDCEEFYYTENGELIETN